MMTKANDAATMVSRRALKMPDLQQRRAIVRVRMQTLFDVEALLLPFQIARIRLRTFSAVTVTDEVSLFGNKDAYFGS